MSRRKRDAGDVSRTVADNIKHLRTIQNLGYTALSNRLSAVGREISAVGVRRIEAMERRVDVDDLVALAAALHTTPIALLGTNTSDHYRRDCLRWLLAEDNHHNATEVIQ